MEQTTSIKEAIREIYLDINIRRLSTCYFHQSGSWLYQKLSADAAGHPGSFSPEERQLFKDALLDFSERIRLAAEKL